MIYRAEPKTLMIFNADTGITAAISGRELDNLRMYLIEGSMSEFIYRLNELGLLPEDLDTERSSILEKIDRAAHSYSPLRSFAAPESIHIDITTVCPLKCPQCYKDYNQHREMSYETFANIIEEASSMGVFQIAIGGGEPLLVQRLADYVQLVRSKGMACTITTSGYGLTLELLSKLKKAGINHMQVSLNGSTEDIHSHSREGFEEALNALQLLSESSIPFGINWVARMDNVYDFKNIVTLAKGLRCDNINLLRYKPSLVEDYNKVALIKEAYELLVEEIINIRGINLKVDSAFSNLLCKIHKGKVSPLNCGCGAGRRFMIVDAFGRFKPCSHMSAVSEGNSLAGYWQNSRELLVLRQGEENIKDQCQSCRYIKACRGCRAICESLYKDINSGEINCWSYCERS
jgi:PqqA peptide cyclase